MTSVWKLFPGSFPLQQSYPNCIGSTKEKYRRIEVINHALQNSFYDSALESCCKMVDCRDVLVASLEITLAL